jgi:hypothetical protein|tara:strand:- start:31 stop:180 length:150 start_codon:yes stop_codon:yes gene_type:complete
MRSVIDLDTQIFIVSADSIKKAKQYPEPIADILREVSLLSKPFSCHGGL